MQFVEDCVTSYIAMHLVRIQSYYYIRNHLLAFGYILLTSLGLIMKRTYELLEKQMMRILIRLILARQAGPDNAHPGPGTGMHQSRGGAASSGAAGAPTPCYS